MDKMLTAKEVAKLLRISLQSVYRNRARLGGIQVVPGGSVRFPENCIGEIGNALPDEKREMARRESYQRPEKDALISHKVRSKEMGSKTNSGRMGKRELADPFNLLA